MSRLLALSLIALSACGQRVDAPQPNGAAAVEPAQPAGGEPANTPRTPDGESTPQAPVASAASPCLVQDGAPVPPNRIRAIGTEPFWGARVEGRCVTYSHPEDQAGTRVWTRFSGTAEKGEWSGALGGKPFVMRTRPEPGCSDGMSDRVYPIAVDLKVGGEERTGCAEPL